jgi:phage shock protein PspC (stress-responsive transcriptional regulator)
MRTWLRRHRIVARLLWAALVLAASEGFLLVYYLDSWLTLPLL